MMTLPSSGFVKAQQTWIEVQWLTPQPRPGMELPRPRQHRRRLFSLFHPYPRLLFKFFAGRHTLNLFAPNIALSRHWFLMRGEPGGLEPDGPITSSVGDPAAGGLYRS